MTAINWDQVCHIVKICTLSWLAMAAMAARYQHLGVLLPFGLFGMTLDHHLLLKVFGNYQGDMGLQWCVLTQVHARGGQSVLFCLLWTHDIGRSSLCGAEWPCGFPGDSGGRASVLCPSTWYDYMAVSQNLRYLFGVGYHPTIVLFKGFLGVHRGYRGFDPLPYILITISCHESSHHHHHQHHPLVPLWALLLFYLILSM